MTTTAKAIKEKGWGSLKELSEQEGRSAFVLRAWHKNKPELFSRFLDEAIKRKVKK